MKGKITPEQRTQALVYLKTKYPNAFRVEGDVKPLEIGIRSKLIAEVTGNLPEDISLHAIYTALNYYCRSPEYKKVRIILGTPRINLLGEVTGEVTEADLILHEQEKIKAKQEKSAKLARVRQTALKTERAQRKRQEKTITSPTDKLSARYIDKTTASIKPPRTVKVQIKQSTHQPTIIVRQRKVLSLPKKKD